MKSKCAVCGESLGLGNDYVPVTIKLWKFRFRSLICSGCISKLFRNCHSKVKNHV